MSLTPNGLIPPLRAGAQARGPAAVPSVLEGRQAEFPRLERGWADQGPTGHGKVWVEAHLSWTVALIRPPPKPRGVWAPIDALIDREASGPTGVAAHPRAAHSAGCSNGTCAAEMPIEDAYGRLKGRR